MYMAPALFRSTLSRGVLWSRLVAEVPCGHTPSQALRASSYPDSPDTVIAQGPYRLAPPATAS